MFKIEYQPLPDANTYLNRIGYQGSLTPDLDTLNALIYQHQCTVPFENLDCCDYFKSISLDVNHLFEKVVLKHRGGYCFELNGIFMALLRSLGFEAWSCFCRTAAWGTEIRPVNHRGIIVRLEEDLYFCDVGFGGPMPPFAVRVCSEHQTLHGETYWAEPLEDQGWFLLNRFSGKGLDDDGAICGQVRSVVVFSLLPAATEDFNAVSHQFSTMPDSTFVCERKVSLRTPDGYINIRNQMLTISSKGKQTQRELSSDELFKVLKELFGLEACEYMM